MPYPRRLLIHFGIFEYTSIAIDIIISQLYFVFTMHSINEPNPCSFDLRPPLTSLKVALDDEVCRFKGSYRCMDRSYSNGSIGQWEHNLDRKK